MMILRGVNVFPTQIEEQLLATKGLAPHYQIELFKDGRMDAMAVTVELADRSGDRVELARELAGRIKDVVGVSAKINVGDPGSAPRSEGKAKRVIDRR